MNTVRDYIALTRLNKPIGIFLLLWPTLWGLWIASTGVPDLYILGVFVTGVVLMRSAGCVINDYADREFDAHVERTRERPLAAGRVSVRSALVLFVILCLIALALVLTLNKLTIRLSLVAVALATVYPFTKRITRLPQVVLGAAFGWSIPMAFAAVNNSVPPVAWVLFATTVLWATAYDTMYAMVDREDDLKINIKSTAILFGKYDRPIIGALQFGVLALLMWTGILAGLGDVYQSSVIIAAGFSLYQQWLILDRDRKKCFRAFLNNNWFGAVIFAGIALDYAL